MIVEKIRFLKQCGGINLFDIENMRFLYCRESNYTYQLDDNTYTCLASEEFPNSESRQTTERFFQYSFKRDIKPVVTFYTLKVLNDSKLMSQLQRIAENCFSHTQSEITFVLNGQFSDNSFKEIMSSCSGIGRSDLVIIKEEELSNFNDKSEENKVESGDMGRLLYYLSSADLNKINYLDKINSPVKIEYNPDRENDLYELVKNSKSKLNFYLREIAYTAQFLSFLINILNDVELNNKLYNLNSIANYLVSNVVFKRNLEIYANERFSRISTQQCDKCWAKNICWSTQSFELFNINLLEVEKYSDQCYSIKTLVEMVILKVRSVENNRKNKVSDTYDFDEHKIKLIN